MAINSVKTIAEEQSFKFLTNQSSILRTVDANSIIYNGVNIILDKPKVGDVMCITKYKDAEGNLLDANQQKVIWIDGKTIDSIQLLSTGLYEIVGVCLSVKGNKATIKYKNNIACNKFSAAARIRVYFESYLNNQLYKIILTLPGTQFDGTNQNTFDFSSNNIQSVITAFNQFFLDNMNYTAGPYTMEEYNGYAILNCVYNDNNDVEKNTKVKFTIKDTSPVKTIYAPNYTLYPFGISDHYYLNNSFKYPKSNNLVNGAACKARYFDYMQVKNDANATIDNPITSFAPATDMTSIDYVTANSAGKQFWYGSAAVTKPEFESNEHCQVLRDNFVNYDKYLDSKMIKSPCNAGGVIKEFNSGKENTYKLVQYTFLNWDSNPANENSMHSQLLFPSISSITEGINVNASGLTAGNWWLPSAAEMVEIMKDITYDTSFWNSKPDSINSTIKRINDTAIRNVGDTPVISFDYIDAKHNYWTSNIWGYGNIYYYYGFCGILGTDASVSKKSNFYLLPITVYEF